MKKALNSKLYAFSSKLLANQSKGDKMGLEMFYYDYEFKTKIFQDIWQCVIMHTFENMELYYRKQLSVQGVFSTLITTDDPRLKVTLGRGVKG